MIKIGRYEKALESIDFAIKYDPGCLKIKNTRAHVLFGLKKHDEAIKILKQKSDSQKITLNRTDSDTLKRKTAKN